VNWSRKKLGDITDLLVGFAFKSQHFIDSSEDGVRLVRGENVQQGFLRWGDKAKKWNNAEYEDFRRYQLEKDDVLLAMDRPIVGGGLKLSWVKEQDLPCLLVQRVARIRGVRDVVRTKFLRYVLSTPEFLGHIESVTTGANIPHISGKDIESFELQLPSLDDQDRIVEILSSYDEFVEINARRVELLEESARLLYREWFVKLRFSGFDQVKWIEGVPEGWSRERLDSALLLQRGFDLPNGLRKQGNVPVYASAGINGYHDEVKIKGPGIVTGRSGTLGLVHYSSGDFWPLNTSLWVKEFRRVTPLFAYFMLSEMNLAQYNSGASVPTLDRKVVHSVEILIPPEKIIGQFGQYVEPIIEQAEYYREANLRAAEARDALLPKLMSGAIQV